MAENNNKYPKPQPQGSQGPQNTSPRRRWFRIFFYVALFGLIGYWYWGEKENGASKEINYTQLQGYIEAGAIEKVEVDDEMKAKANVKSESYTLVFGSTESGNEAKGTVKTQVPSLEEFSKFVDAANAKWKE